MPVVRASDASIRINQQYNLNKKQRDVESSNYTAASGVKGSTYASLSEVAQTSQMTKVKNAALDQEITSLTLINNDLETIDAIYRRFSDITTHCVNRTLNYTSTFSGDLSFQDECKRFLKEIEALLNTKSAQGGFLFAGTNENQIPVRDLDTLALPGPGMPLDLSAISDFQDSPPFKNMNILGYKISLDYKFDNPEIMDMIHALVIVAHTERQPKVGSDDYNYLIESMELGQRAQQAMNAKMNYLGAESQIMMQRIDLSKDQTINNLNIIQECDTIPQVLAMTILQDHINEFKQLTYVAHLFNKTMAEALQTMRP